MMSEYDEGCMHALPCVMPCDSIRFARPVVVGSASGVRLWRADDEHGTCSVIDDSGRGRAEHSIETAIAVRADHDHIHRVLLSAHTQGLPLSRDHDLQRESRTKRLAERLRAALEPLPSLRLQVLLHRKLGILPSLRWDFWRQADGAKQQQLSLETQR